MKGIGPLIVAIIALILLITIITGSSIYLAAKSETVIRTAQETAVMNGINSLEILRDSLTQALAYSSYQGFYTVSANGGYDKIPSTVVTNNGIPYWRIYSDASGYPIGWQDNMQTAILGYLNEYVLKLQASLISILQTSSVTIPTYNLNLIPGSSAGVNNYMISATSSDFLQFSSQSFAPVGNPSTFVFTIKDNPTLSKTINTNVNNMFTQSFVRYAYGDAVQDGINAAKNSLPTTCTSQATSYCDTQTQPSCTSLYPATCSTSFKSSVDNSLQQVPSFADMQMSVNIVDTEIAYSSQSVIQSSVPSQSCGCMSQDTKGNCLAYNHLITISCTYNNYAASKVLLTVTDTQNKYPVYDGGATDVKSTQLKFYVLSGSDYTQAPSLLKP